MDNVRKLVQRAQRGDTAAFEELVRQYQDRIYALSYHLSGNQADAEDLAQEAFVKAFYGLKGFRNEADFGTWLHRITVNLWINVRRRERQTVSLDEPVQTGDGEVQRELAATAEEPPEVLERKEFQRFVQRALGEISREHRVVLVLREMHDYSYEEIARVLDCSLGTVKSRISRARTALKEKACALAEQAGVTLPVNRERRGGDSQ
ncbi:MAG: sigma-70 family RNA polymerase sigma factor [Bacillota bacterium]